MANKILTHAGGLHVTRASVDEIITPDATSTWYPLRHGALIDEVKTHLTGSRYNITQEHHVLSHGGQRYFGLLELQHESSKHDDYGWVVGIRNSHDQKFSAGLLAGSQVTICDNLAFFGEVNVTRKHTKNAASDLQRLTAGAVGELSKKLGHVDNRIATYKKHELRDMDAHDLIMRGVDCQAIPNSRIPAVLKGWRKPEHEVFEERSVWSLFNSFTDALKGTDPNLLVRRTVALHGLMDGYVGLN
jgi:hypothetical protein